MLASILLLAHGAAVAVVLLVGLPLWLEVTAVAALSLNLAHGVWRKAILRSTASIATIEIASDDTFSIQTRHGEWIECEVRGDTFVLWFLTVLNLRRRDSGARISVVILPDAIDAEEFRRLRVWLRWKDDRQPR